MILLNFATAPDFRLRKIDANAGEFEVKDNVGLGAEMMSIFIETCISGRQLSLDSNSL